MRRVLAGAFVAVLVSSSAAGAQYRGVRFEITSVGDSTFAFSSGSEKWIKTGLVGIAVDPKRRDALVARFRVTSVRAGEASALVEGQTTNIRTDHVVVLEEPRRSWFTQATFWWGLVTGSALGVSVALTR